MVAGVLERDGEDSSQTGAFRGWIGTAMALQEGRAFLWSPVALTLGIWVYFGLPVEPSAYAVLIAAVLAVPLMWLGRRSGIVVLIGLVVMGFCIAKFRSDWTATPLLRATTAQLAVTGTVLSVESTGSKRFAVILSPDLIDGLPTGEVPKRLRLSAGEKSGRPAVGGRVTLKARLSPVPAPVAPGAFDYGRRLWFESIGGTGRVMGEITVMEGAAPSFATRFDSFLQSVRSAMGRRIHAVLEDPIASFAEALITGERSTIPKDLNQSLMVSGLFHILSISGLHMWMVAGGVFWAVRAMLALVPRLAVHRPIKKWAAAVALGMGWFYMLLADSGVATERSFIMIAVVFFAVMVDRPALSTRNLAIAAIIVLGLEPEAAVEASFQMSFLAVLGLVSFYEAWSRLNATRDPERTITRSWLVRNLRKIQLAVFLSIATTLIAGTMSTIPAAYHFGRLAPYAVVANGLTLPVIGIFVMPPALLAAVLMPLGLESLPLWVMGKGLEMVLLISDWVATFPGAHVVVAQPPVSASILLAAGAATFCLLAGSARWLGVALVTTGLLLVAIPQEGPDLLIERTAANVALRNPSGELVPAQARRSRFAVEKWLQVNGEEITPAVAAKRPGWTCTKARCTATVKGKSVAYLMGEGPATECTGIDILIARFPLRHACPAVPVRIDRFDVWRKGAYAVYIKPAEIRFETARDAQGNRPWVYEPRPRGTAYRPPDREPE